MTIADGFKRAVDDLMAGVQFLTRIPMPSREYRPDGLASAVKFFPLVGALIGGMAVVLWRVLGDHLPRAVVAGVVIVFLVLVTGALHEDGLADAADGFGGGSTREKTLLILRDSRIGTYGAVALCMSLVGRALLIAELPVGRVAAYLIVANVLCRWTILPLSYFLPSAREGEGQGARIARLTSRSSLILGTVFAVGLTVLLLRWRACAPLLAAVLLTWMSGRLYWRKIGGVTGDCFGATTQVTELAIYLCGVWAA